MEFHLNYILLLHVIGIALISLVIFLALKRRFLTMRQEDTEHLKKTEDELDLLRVLMNQVKECALLIDDKGVVQVVNACFLRYYGKPSEKIVGKSIQRIHTDFFETDHQEPLKKSLDETGLCEFDVNFFDRNGNTIPFHVVIQSYPTHHGNYYGITAIDQKESIENIEFIRQQQEELLEIQHLAHLGYWEINYLTKKIYWSRELYSILGYEDGEIEPNLDMIYWMAYGDDQNQVEKAFLRAFQKQEKVDTQYRLKNNQGEILDIFLRVRHFFSKDNEHLRTIGVLQDITKQVRIREELKAELSFSDKVLNNSNLLFVAYNSDFKVTRINDYTSQLAGLNREEFQGENLIEILEKLNPKHKNSIRKSMDFIEPMFLKDANGNRRCIQWDHAVFKDENGEDMNILLGVEIQSNHAAFTAESGEDMNISLGIDMDEIIEKTSGNNEKLQV